MKRLLAVLLAALMLLSLVACGNDPVESNVESGSETDAPETGDEGFTLADQYNDPDVYTTFNGGTITTTASGGSTGGTIATVPYAGITGKDYSDEKFYTYNDFMGGTTGLNWNPHTWETNDDSYVLAYLTMGFYDFALNEDCSGYAIVPEMAADYPVDVTADYVGKFGIKEGETAKAWKIALNPAATWDDGTPITADDYIYSMQQQLSPKMLNRRADSYYAGDLVVYNAKAYLYSGKTSTEDNGATGAYALEDLVKGADGVYTTKNGEPIVIATGAGLDWLSGNSLAAYVNAYGAAYFGMDAWASLIALADANGNVPVTDESIGFLTGVITAVADWGESAADVVNYMTYDIQNPVTDWESVGLVKVDDYTIVLALLNPIEEPAFYVPYNLSSTWLVKKDLYEASKKFFDAEGKELTADGDNCVTITSTYCTTVASSASYGPYKLTYFEADKQLTFERNDKWYGYTDGKHVGQFQADKISCQVIAEHKTALQAFLAGDIDGVGLQSEDMAAYASSDRIRYTPESYTTKITFNTDYEKLVALGNNAQILAVKEFRQAFSLALDRQDFTTAYTSAAAPGFGLLNYMYCYNPFSGELYRDDDSAKAALCAVYGVTYGEDGEFETLEEAYEALTGFDMAAAQELMQVAYDKAVAAKVYDGKSEIKLDFRVYNTDEIYVKMFNYFDGQLKKACEGTGFEGKVSLTMTADADYYETMYAGNTAIIFSTWGGAAMAPFSMLGQCYTDAYDGSGNQMEIGYNTSLVKVTFTIDGKEVTASLKDWADWAAATPDTAADVYAAFGNFADYSYATRCEIFAVLEQVYLESFATVPMYYRNGASLSSRKLESGTDTYLQIIGRGGIRHITFNYSDEEWNAVKGTITY